MMLVHIEAYNARIKEIFFGEELEALRREGRKTQSEQREGLCRL